MNRSNLLLARSRALLSLTAGTLAVAVQADMYDPVTPSPGGISPNPQILSISETAEGATVTWQGISGSYQLLKRASVTSPAVALGQPTTATSATIATEGELGILQVAGASPNYTGAHICGACHADVHDTWMATTHAKAFDTLKNIGQDKNAYCLPCHTVGFGMPNGFVNEMTNPWLAGVQCENCHGPGGGHVANTDDVSVRPQITISAKVCGGCHNGFHHPTYDEWHEAGHANVSEPGMFNAGVSRMYQCGTCHAGAVRAAVVKDYDNGGNGTEVVPPSVADANKYGQTCSTCHDPHQKFTETLPGTDLLAKPAQLRNPIGSTTFMSYFTSTSPTNFAAQYNPNIQICGQCHNERGANWTGTGRPPHHSPQYNILIGQAVDPQFDTNTLNGELVLFNKGAAGHGDSTVPAPFGNPAQCTTCHNRADAGEEPSPASPSYTGHKFEVQLLACADCHGFLEDPDAEEIAEGGVEFIQAGIHDGIKKAQDALNTWAATKIPGIDTPGHTNYIAFIGTNDPAIMIPWETTTAGQLNTGKKGAPTAGQNRTPAAIKQSRFLLYLVEHDASYGVHNPPYARYLLKTATEFAEAAPAVPAE